MDAEMENMESVGVREEDAQDRVRWRQMIGCGHPRREQLKGKKKKKRTFLCHSEPHFGAAPYN